MAPQNNPQKTTLDWIQELAAEINNGNTDWGVIDPFIEAVSQCDEATLERVLDDAAIQDALNKPAVTNRARDRNVDLSNADIDAIDLSALNDPPGEVLVQDPPEDTAAGAPADMTAPDGGSQPSVESTPSAEGPKIDNKPSNDTSLIETVKDLATSGVSQVKEWRPHVIESLLSSLPEQPRQVFEMLNDELEDLPGEIMPEVLLLASASQAGVEASTLPSQFSDNPLRVLAAIVPHLDKRIAELTHENSDWLNHKEYGDYRTKHQQHYASQLLLDTIPMVFFGDNVSQTFTRLHTLAQTNGMKNEEFLNQLADVYTPEALQDPMKGARTLIGNLNKWAKDNNKKVDFSKAAVESGIDALPSFLRVPAQWIADTAHSTFGTGYDTLLGVGSWFGSMAGDVKNAFGELFSLESRYNTSTALDEQILNRMLVWNRAEALGDVSERQTQAGMRNIQQLARKLKIDLHDDTARQIVQIYNSPMTKALRQQMLTQIAATKPEYKQILQNIDEMASSLFVGPYGDYAGLYDTAVDGSLSTEAMLMFGQFAQLAAAGPTRENAWAKAADYQEALTVMRNTGLQTDRYVLRGDTDVLRGIKRLSEAQKNQFTRQIESAVLSDMLDANNFHGDKLYNDDGTLKDENFVMRYYDAEGKLITEDEWKKLPADTGRTSSNIVENEVTAAKEASAQAVQALLVEITRASSGTAAVQLLRQYAQESGTSAAELAKKHAAQKIIAFAGGAALETDVAERLRDLSAIQTAAQGLSDFDKFFKPGQELEAAQQFAQLLGSTNLNAENAAEQASRNIRWTQANDITLERTVSIAQAVGQQLQKLGVSSEEIGGATEFAQMLHYSNMHSGSATDFDPNRSMAQSAQVASRIFASDYMENAAWILSQDEDTLDKLGLIEAARRIRSGQGTEEDYQLIADRETLRDLWMKAGYSSESFDSHFTRGGQQAIRNSLSAADKQAAAMTAHRISNQRDVIENMTGASARYEWEKALEGRVPPDKKTAAINAATALISTGFTSHDIKELLSNKRELTELERTRLKNTGQDAVIMALEGDHLVVDADGVEQGMWASTNLAGMTVESYDLTRALDEAASRRIAMEAHLSRILPLPENSTLQAALDAEGGILTFAANLLKGKGYELSEKQIQDLLAEEDTQAGLQTILFGASIQKSPREMLQLLFGVTDPGNLSDEQVKNLASDLGIPIKDKSRGEVEAALFTKLSSLTAEELPALAETWAKGDKQSAGALLKAIRTLSNAEAKEQVKARAESASDPAPVSGTETAAPEPPAGSTDTPPSEASHASEKNPSVVPAAESASGTAQAITSLLGSGIRDWVTKFQTEDNSIRVVITNTKDLRAEITGNV
ncbi:MAG: hypothetical protein IJV70_06055 [Clostridia bacterium]|nr:hypothetical protein [Clostridia bacterium]